MQARLHEFHLEVQEGRGAIPLTWRPPPAYESGTKPTTLELLSIRGSTHSDVEVRMIVLVVAIPIYFILHEHKCEV